MEELGYSTDELLSFASDLTEAEKDQIELAACRACDAYAPPLIFTRPWIVGPYYASFFQTRASPGAEEKDVEVPCPYSSNTVVGRSRPLCDTIARLIKERLRKPTNSNTHAS